MNLRLQLAIISVALRQNGTRSLFAVAAMALGIAAMMVVMALGTGADRQMQSIADQGGRNLFVIRAGRRMAGPGRGQGWYSAQTLTLDDVAAMREQLHGVHDVAAVLEGSRLIKFNRERAPTSVRGVSPQFVELRKLRLSGGRALDAFDDLSRSRVAIVGYRVARRLNGARDMVGQTISIGNVPFEVIGQLSQRGLGADGTDEDDQVLIPLSTATRRVFNVDYLSRLLVQVERQEDSPRVQSEARELLRGLHQLPVGVEDDFEVLTTVRTDRVRQMNSMIMGGLAQLFAQLTLAIGGIGVFTVTYLNVKDRTGEIGLRMAIGATRTAIGALFVAEACSLSIAGGLIGLLAGWSGIIVLGYVTNWPLAVDLHGVAMPFALSIALGLVFGAFPAVKASSLMPVQALRAH